MDVREDGRWSWGLHWRREWFLGSSLWVSIQIYPFSGKRFPVRNKKKITCKFLVVLSVLGVEIGEAVYDDAVTVLFPVEERFG